MDEKAGKQLSLLEGEEFDYFFFVSNGANFSSEEVVFFLRKHGNAEDCITILLSQRSYFPVADAGL